jgi:hypothetical protein
MERSSNETLHEPVAASHVGLRKHAFCIAIFRAHRELAWRNHYHLRAVRAVAKRGSNPKATLRLTSDRYSALTAENDSKYQGKRP